jgi:ribosomal protein L22
MREKTTVLLANLEKSTENKTMAEPASGAQLKLDECVKGLNKNIDDAVDQLTAALQARKEHLKLQLASFAENEKQDIADRQNVLESKLKETMAFCDKSSMVVADDDTSLTQTELFQFQTQSEKHEKENSDLLAEAAMPAEANVGLDTEALKIVIGEFGHMVVRRISRQDDASPSSSTPDVRPRVQRKPKEAFKSDAEVLLFGLSRRPKGNWRGKTK